MPELPEVETIKCGITPHLIKQTIQHVIVRQRQLRWPIAADLHRTIAGQTIQAITRRSKYLIVKLSKDYLIIHLGMSGRLQIVPTHTPYQKHDHVDFKFANHCLRYHDPRRFGAIVWTDHDPKQHPLLSTLGVEPLTDAFNADYLYTHAQRSKSPIKNLLMNAKIVVGIGNIYAAESLFLSNIHPLCSSKQLSHTQCQQLVSAAKQTLLAAIAAGGTTLKDFYNGEGKPGYFQQALQVYGRDGQACVRCKSRLEKLILQQRSTVYCPSCQN